MKQKTIFCLFNRNAVSGKIDLKKGILFDYMINGKQPIRQYPEPAFWRAPIDNDFGNKMPVLAGVWRTAHVNRYVKKVTIGENNEKGLSVRVDWVLSDIQVPYTMEYLVRDNGTVIVTGSIDDRNETSRTSPFWYAYGIASTL